MKENTLIYMKQNIFYAWSKILPLLESEFIWTNFKFILRDIWNLIMKINQIASSVMCVDSISISHDAFW